MLKQRIITALLMLAILLPSIFYPAPEAFGVVALVLVSAGAWSGLDSINVARQLLLLREACALAFVRCPGMLVCWAIHCICSGL